MKWTTHKRQLFIAALAASCLLHVVVFTILFVKRSPQNSSVHTQRQVQSIVDAVAVNQQDVEREVQKIQTQQLLEQQTRQAEESRYNKAVALAKKNQQDARRAVAKLNEQQKRISETLKKSKLLAKKRAHDEVIRKQKLDKLAKKQLEMQEKIKKQRAQEKTLKLASEKQKKLAELKQKNDAELNKKKRQEELAKLAKLREKAANDALEKQMQQDQSQLANAEAKQVALEVAKYKAKIIAAVGRTWLIPKNADKKLSCQLLIHLGPGGVVLDVSTLKSSGDSLLDRSAKTAVLKASPLPVPDKSELFESFRELHLTVRPEEIRGSSTLG